MAAPPSRYRCSACGNLTRFDVTVTRRVKEFHHFSVGGELEVESAEVLAEDVEEVACRWCGATGEAIEVLSGDAVTDAVTDRADAAGGV
ncbi:MAG: hypothetical protein FJW88_09265 [Actinobacteria bacterium]|nr:hypothetical protein [Actinomycetota bacterium]